jgi:branched-chain amino acid transport system substrate-binding protein
VKRQRLFAIFLVLLMVVAACADEDSETTTTAASSGTTAGSSGTTAAPSGDPIKFAASLPLTGMFSIPGTLHQEGYEFCVEAINERGGLLGRPVELITSDNKSETETVVNQYERFINVDEADVILGTFSTLLSFPSSSISEQSQMVFPEPSDSSLMSHSRGYTYNFGFTLKPIDFIGQSPVDALQYYLESGVIPEGEFPKTAAVVYQDDFFPNAISRGLLGGTLNIPGTDESIDFSPGYLADSGIEVVLEEQFPAEFDDWISLGNSVKEADADLLIALTTPPVEVDLVRAFGTVGYQPKAAFFSQGTYAEFLEALGSAVNGIMVWTTWAPEIEWEGELAGGSFGNKEFVEEFQARFGRVPDEDQAQAFTVCQTMAQAIEDTGTTDNTALRDWMAARTAADPARTIQGDYYWDEKGLTAGRDVLLLQWQDEQLKFVFPRGDAYTSSVDLLYPKPEW